MTVIVMGKDSATELKGIYVYLVSDSSTYITDTDVIVDGGYCA
jgi:hypothetical protein